MKKIGILAYGSLIDDPGVEIENLIDNRIKNIKTPFKIEFARKSKSRGYGPTLTPVIEGGSHVNAQIFVLKSKVNEKDAKDILYRRELHKENCDIEYAPSENPTKNNVIIKRIEDFNDVNVVFYTVIGRNIEILTPNELSRLAINSVKFAEECKDGITYLIDAKKNGIITPLMDSYEQRILDITSTETLELALSSLRIQI